MKYSMKEILNYTAVFYCALILSFINYKYVYRDPSFEWVQWVRIVFIVVLSVLVVWHLYRKDMRLFTANVINILAVFYFLFLSTIVGFKLLNGPILVLNLLFTGMFFVMLVLQGYKRKSVPRD